MNALYRLPRIIGTVCLSCVCLTSKADPKILTLEELREFLDQQCTEATEKLEAIREKIKEGNARGFAPTYDKEENSYSYNVPSEFSEKFKGITHIEYNTDGEPTLIETVNGWTSGMSEVLQIFPSENTPFRQYIRKRFFGKTSAECLDSVSKKLTEEELKARGIADADRERYEIDSVREITFDSILSGFFDKNAQIKGRTWVEDSGKLSEAIDAYANQAMFSKPVTCRRKNTHIDLVTETSSNSSTFKIREEARQSDEYEADFFYRVSGERRERMKQVLAGCLKGLLRYKNGKEKVILLLLLDEKTQSDFKLKWMHESKRYGEYDAHKNLILFDFEAIGCKALSHEIGHYLQTHLGLHQDLKTNDEFCEAFKGYQTKFAKELLLLEPTEPKTAQEISVPSGLSCDIAVFYDNPHLSDPQICFRRFSEQDLFVHWQLVSRWDNIHEPSNILGVYFHHSQKTIYVCALSDIRELKSVRYGHDPRNARLWYLKDPNGEYWEKFETPEAQTAFENIVLEAADQKPSTDALKFLCKLHKRSGDENKVVNLFDYDQESFLTQCLSYLLDFRTPMNNG